MASTRPNFQQPVWSGQDLRGKTILLRAEQGFGDVIQFVRYAPSVKALGAKVLLQLNLGLERMAKSFVGIDGIWLPDQPSPAFDFYIHLMSLPGVFGTELDSIPADIPYLHAEPEKADEWARRLQSSEARKVGLVWAGNPGHLRDRYRSMSLHTLAPLFDVGGHSLLFSCRRVLRWRKPRSSSLELIDLDPELQDWSDTAAAISQLDLVICVDTAVAHVAGAMGKPVWVMLPRNADWRWLLDRDDSPWYPTMRLFRQSRHGDWDEVVGRVKASLKAWVDGAAPSTMPMAQSSRHR